MQITIINHNTLTKQSAKPRQSSITCNKKEKIFNMYVPTAKKYMLQRIGIYWYIALYRNYIAWCTL